MKNTLALLATVLMIYAFGAQGEEDSFELGPPKQGFVPDAKTAIRVAEAILIALYGEEDLSAQQPLVAILQGNSWRVLGTSPTPPEGVVIYGTIAVVEISKTDGKITRVFRQ